MVKQVASILLVGMLALRTGQRVADWATPLTLAQATLRVHETGGGWLLLSAAIADQGDRAGALDALDRAEALRPDYAELARRSRARMVYVTP